jgi:hypothetical protein
MAPSVGPERLRMVRLVTADDGFQAKVLAARLGVEGIVWELRGGVDGPYPFGPVHVFVTEDDLDDARAVLAAATPLDEVGDEDDDGDDLERPSSVPHRRAVLAGAAVVAVLGLAAAELVRMLVGR